MILVILRTLILFAAVVIFLRMMGKRQIGQLQPYELVIIIMISELAAIPMENTGIPLLSGLVPIFVLFVAQVTLAYVSLKNERARRIICGKPSIMIENGKIKENELRKLRYNINDLLEQLRAKNVSNLSDVEYAILETGGQLNVILKSQKRPVQPQDLNLPTNYEGLPTTLITDGHVIHENLKVVNLGVDWLQAELKKFGVNCFQEVLIASLDTQGNLYYQLKSARQE